MSTPVVRDPFVATATTTFAVSASALTEARSVLAGGAHAVYHRLAVDHESECEFILARHVLHGFLDGATTAPADYGVTAINARTERVRTEIAGMLANISKDDQPWRAVLAQRAPLALLGHCWLDVVSQPATQPAQVVNHLMRHQFALRGEGRFECGQRAVRSRALTEQRVHLPDVTATEFLRKAEARPLTAWHGAYRLSLASVPATFLPEVVATHCVLTALGVDELLLGTDSPLSPGDVWTMLDDYLSVAPEPIRHRVAAAADLALAMERQHIALITELADWRAGLSLDAEVTRIVLRHAPFAGKQHQTVQVANRLLTEWFADVEGNAVEFVRSLRESPQLRPRDGGCRFLNAIKFGGPMFGIFSDEEAATFGRWAETIANGEQPGNDLTPNSIGDRAADALAAAIAEPVPEAIPCEPTRGNDREFFHHLVNIENFPNTIGIGQAFVEDGLRKAEILFDHGAAGILTDASWFDYSPQALESRVDRIYWEKMVDPYEPLSEIPSREAVIFGQKAFALGSMVDGAWVHRIARAGHDNRRSDAMLYAIYADEMGRGDPVKNHLTLIYQSLESMGIRTPHIRESAFLEQKELPDFLYDFSLFQLCIALFPDRYYDEIIGYNLGIEMFGLGAQRIHEMKKLRHYGFDVAYEEAHLSIDNLSTGHARQSADIIITYLHDVAAYAGPNAVAEHWRRVWRGYASFAYFVEHQLVASLR